MQQIEMEREEMKDHMELFDRQVLEVAHYISPQIPLIRI